MSFSHKLAVWGWILDPGDISNQKRFCKQRERRRNPGPKNTSFDEVVSEHSDFDEEEANSCYIMVNMVGGTDINFVNSAVQSGGHLATLDADDRKNLNCSLGPNAALCLFTRSYEPATELLLWYDWRSQVTSQLTTLCTVESVELQKLI